jgi:SAM-dependent methyltransferase
MPLFFKPSPMGNNLPASDWGPKERLYHPLRDDPDRRARRQVSCGRRGADPLMSRPRKKLSLATIVREFVLVRRFRQARHDGRLDFDWGAANYDRKAVVNLLLAGAPDGAYLEIGCADNALFDAVMVRRKVGVDPRQGGTHRMTSDAYFATDAGERFDVVFVDGLHLYDQVRRDLDGALSVLNPGGWIAFHDMLPRDWLEEHVPQIRTRGWTGDGWKLAFELLASPDVAFRLLAVDHGVLVVKPLTATPRIPDLSATLARERFDYLYRNFALLPVVGYHEAADWIASHRGPPPEHPSDAQA